IVRDSTRADMQAMAMEIRRVEMMRPRPVYGHRIRVRRQVVGEADAQAIGGLEPQGRAGNGSLMAEQRKAGAGDILVGAGDAQARAELAIGGRAHVGLDERGVLLEGRARYTAGGHGHVVGPAAARKRKAKKRGPQSGGPEARAVQQETAA